MTSNPVQGRELSESPEAGPRVSPIVVLLKILSVVIVPLLGVYLLKLVLVSMGLLTH